jgi:hypothetical protein
MRKLSMTRLRRWTRGPGLLLAVWALCGAATEVRAGPWSYEWISHNDKIIFGSGNNELDLTGGPSGTTSGNQSILALQFDVVAPFVGATDSFTAQNYSLTLKLKDLDSGDSTDLLFAANLSGSASLDSTSFTNEFVEPTEYTVPLGDADYKVTIGPFVKPGPAGGATGTLHASVEVIGEPDTQVPDNPTPTHETPEPGTLLLAGLAAACSGAAAVRRRWKQSV